NGIDPRNILLLTFTNKAAREMLVRVTNLLPVDASGLWGGTFHSVGNRILRRHGTALGYSGGFTIMDREDQKDLIETVVASAGIDPKVIRFPKGDILAEIFSFVVNTEKPLEQLLAEKFPYFLPLLDKIQDVHERYEKKKKATNSMDFDDLLQILEVATAATAANLQELGRRLSATREAEARKPALAALKDGAGQAQFVAQRVRELRDEGVDLKDIAVLYRADYHA